MGECRDAEKKELPKPPSGHVGLFLLNEEVFSFYKFSRVEKARFSKFSGESFWPWQCTKLCEFLEGSLILHKSTFLLKNNLNVKVINPAGRGTDCIFVHLPQDL